MVRDRPGMMLAIYEANLWSIYVACIVISGVRRHLYQSAYDFDLVVEVGGIGKLLKHQHLADEC